MIHYNIIIAESRSSSRKTVNRPKVTLPPPNPNLPMPIAHCVGGDVLDIGAFAIGGCTAIRSASNWLAIPTKVLHTCNFDLLLYNRKSYSVQTEAARFI